MLEEDAVDDRLQPSLVCTCMHAEDRHAKGPCSGRDSYGLPCECPSFEVDRHWSGLDAESDEG